jgi:hypothetical protein
MKTATDTRTRGPMRMNNINIAYFDDSFCDLIDFYATCGCTTEFEHGCEYRCNSDDILL